MIVRRSGKLNFYPNYWNGISGFLDDRRSLQKKIEDEIKEETGISKKEIFSIRLGNIFHQKDKRYKKTWIVHPVLVKIKIDKIKFDWETQDYKWIKVNEIRKFKLLPGFEKVIRSFFKLIKN
ncbi:MAG: NUDIX domain-containing protein [Candidatus Pacearchaeota archaeon]